MTKRQISCPKCSGTGIVQRFLDHESGVCFDCNGSGSLVVSMTRSSRKLDPRKIARALGDAALAGQHVDNDDATQAFEIFEATPRTQWNSSDYDRRNALGRLVGRVI